MRPAASASSGLPGRSATFARILVGTRVVSADIEGSSLGCVNIDEPVVRVLNTSAGLLPRSWHNQRWDGAAHVGSDQGARRAGARPSRPGAGRYLEQLARAGRRVLTSPATTT